MTRLISGEISNYIIRTVPTVQAHIILYYVVRADALPTIVTVSASSIDYSCYFLQLHITRFTTNFESH